MATPDQVRECQEQLLSAFQGQQDASSPLAFPEVIEAAVERAIATLTRVDGEQHSDEEQSDTTLLPPSEAARDFPRRAMANPTVRDMIARLADE
jgi:hypothetical protein